MSLQVKHLNLPALRQRWKIEVRRTSVTPYERLRRGMMQLLLAHPDLRVVRDVSLKVLLLLNIWDNLTTRVIHCAIGISAVAVAGTGGWIFWQLHAADESCLAVMGRQSWPPCALLGLALLPLLVSSMWMAMMVPVAIRLTQRACRQLQELAIQVACLLLQQVRQWVERLQERQRSERSRVVALLAALPPPDQCLLPSLPRVVSPGVQTLAP